MSHKEEGSAKNRIFYGDILQQRGILKGDQGRVSWIEKSISLKIIRKPRSKRQAMAHINGLTEEQRE